MSKSWHQLLAALDATLRFPNQTNATLSQIEQSYDEKEREYVVWLEYRVKADPGSNEGNESTSSAMPLLAEINFRIIE